MDEIKQIMESIRGEWAAFKADNDRRLAEKAAGKSDPLTEEKIDRHSKAIGELEKQLRELETKAARPNLGAQADEAGAEHRKGFLAYVRKGIKDGLAGLQEKAVSLGVSADGGYAVNKELDQLIDKVLVQAVPMRGLCKVITVRNESYEKLISQGGAASGWVGETDARGETNTPTLASVKPVFGEVYANPGATQRSLDDIFFNVEAWLAEEIAAAFALAENTAFVSGNGTNKPKGFLAYTIAASPTFGQLKQVKSGSAGAFAVDKLFDVVHALKAQYRPGAVWMMPTLAVAELRKLKDSTNQYLWQPGLQAGAPSTLVGYKVIENEDMPAMSASSNSVAFGDFAKGYQIADVKGTRVIRDELTNKPKVHFYTTKRVGGGLLDSNAIVIHTLGV